MEVYQLLTILRFRAIVFSPINIRIAEHPAIRAWVNSAGPEFGIVKGRLYVPDHVMNAILSMNCDWDWSNHANGPTRIRLTSDTIFMYCHTLGLKTAHVGAAVRAYVRHIELNGCNPLEQQEIWALESLGVKPLTLPILDKSDLQPIYFE